MVNTNAKYRLSGRNRTKILLLTIFLLTALLFSLDIILGSVTIKLKDIFDVLLNKSDSEIYSVIVKFRIPKAITALLVGVSLSVSGLQMQTIFRNPMAGPYVLGISSGASLGVAVLILGFSDYFTAKSLELLGNWSLAAASWAGAGIVMVIIMLISIKIKDILAILILGIMLSGGISSIVSIMQYFSSETMLKSYVIWTMGSLGNVSSEQLEVMALCIAAGLIISLFSLKMLNAILLGETYAETLGVNIKKARILVFVSTSLLAGTVTAFCGPVGFIGIAVPHIARMIFKTSDHRVLMPSVILAGASLMLVSDIISQLPGSERVLPVNAVTSLIGIPVVIWVILKTRKYA
ncbi:MAG TPA: iron ABC transporter permease [Bacteroidales bacterium]|nr:iron ABC transporter permease [Bacteroidales bacterium]